MTAASGADRECPHNEDRASCAVGCGNRAGGGDELYQYTVTNGSHARASRSPASGADQPTLSDQLAEALANARPWLESWDELPEVLRDQFRISVDALLPLIEAGRERAKAEGGAEALEQAADWIVKTDFDRQHPDLFRAIADVLHAQARWSRT